MRNKVKIYIYIGVCDQQFKLIRVNNKDQASFYLLKENN